MFKNTTYKCRNTEQSSRLSSIQDFYFGSSLDCPVISDYVNALKLSITHTDDDKARTSLQLHHVFHKCSHKWFSDKWSVDETASQPQHSVISLFNNISLLHSYGLALLVDWVVQTRDSHVTMTVMWMRLQVSRIPNSFNLIEVVSIQPQHLDTCTDKTRSHQLNYILGNLKYGNNAWHNQLLQFLQRQHNSWITNTIVNRPEWQNYILCRI